MGPNGPNNKHGFSEHLWHIASTTSTVASLQVARLGWLQRICIKAKSSPESPWENWSLPTTSQLHDPASWWLSQICDSYAAAFCCRGVGPNVPNNKHGFSEHLWHVASTTSTVASLQVARLGWIQRICIKAKSSPESPWENWSLPTTLQLHDPASWWLSHSCDSYAAAFAVEVWAQMDQITNTAWKNTCGASPVQLQQ